MGYDYFTMLRTDIAKGKQKGWIEIITTELEKYGFGVLREKASDTYYRYANIDFGKKVQMKRTEKAYCVVCRQTVYPEDIELKTVIVKGKGTRKAITGRCPECNTRLFKFVKG